MDYNKKYAIIFFLGIILQCAVIIGICISSTNQYIDINDTLYQTLLIPNLVSYIFIVLGFLGLIGLIKKK